MDDDGLNEDMDNIIVLNDENGNEVKFEFLDLIDYDSEEYVVLLPVEDENTDEDDEGQVVILKVDDSEENSDQESYLSVDDDETLNAVFNIFKDKFKDEFDFTDAEE